MQIPDNLIERMRFIFERMVNGGARCATNARPAYINVLKINGFPVGQIDLSAVIHAVESDALPLTSCSANGINAPTNNAGLYQGRIEQLNPMRHNTSGPNAHVNPKAGHNMSNLTYPSLADGEEQEDVDPENHDGGCCAHPERGDAFGDGEFILREEEELFSTDEDVAVHTEPQRLYVALDAEQAPIEADRIRFHESEDGTLEIEPALSAAESDWWKKLSATQKREYLKRHPRSKYAKAYNAKLEKKRAALKEAERKAKAKEKAKGKKRGAVTERPARESFTRDEDEMLMRTLTAADVGIDFTHTLEEQEEAHAQDDENGDDDDFDMDLLEDDDEENAAPSPAQPPPIPPAPLNDLRGHADRPGFFNAVKHALRRKVSHTSLASMARLVSGRGRDGDAKKAARGIAVICAGVGVLALGAGIGAVAGPGLMMKYFDGYMTHVASNAGRGHDGSARAGGFEFSGESSGAGISDADIELLGKQFIEYVISQQQQQEDNA